MAPAEIRSYRGLIEALRARKHELDVSCLTLDHVAGLASGHSGKLLGQGLTKGLGDVSLPLLLDALGLKLLLVPDDERLAKVRDRLTKRRLRVPAPDGSADPAPPP